MNRTISRILFLALAGAGLALASCQSAPVPDPDPEAQVMKHVLKLSTNSSFLKLKSLKNSPRL